jgi:transposase
MSVGVDIGKDVFHLVGFDKVGQLVLRKKIKRMALISTFEGLPKCVVGMEGCLSSRL